MDLQEESRRHRSHDVLAPGYRKEKSIIQVGFREVKSPKASAGNLASLQGRNLAGAHGDGDTLSHHPRRKPPALSLMGLARKNQGIEEYVALLDCDCTYY